MRENFLLNDNPTILMYSHDGQGLGHLRRNTNIARQAVQDLPNCNAVLLTGHRSVPFQPLPHGVDFIKLPSIIRVNYDEWEPASLSINHDTIGKLRRSIIQETAMQLKPDVFIVDFMPSGIWNELIPTLQALRELENPPLTILGLRDIIDDPVMTRRKWRKENYYEVIRKYYDHVFIYGSPDVYDTAYHYGLTGDLEEKVRYCGYVCSKDPCKKKEQMKIDLGIEKEHLILITAGGGGDAFPMFNLCLEAIRDLQNELSFEAVMITGPVMDFEERQSLTFRSKDLPVRILPNTDCLQDYMSAADLVVCMGGYNTLIESVRLKKNVIVIPRNGPREEQKIRAQIFSDFGLVHCLESPNNLDSASITKCIRNALLYPLTPKRSLDCNGQANAIKQIRRLLNNSSLDKEDLIVTI